jgi:NAD(P)-dependent dehydrogenase (short-subunit alcohol dehydrogenase family)
MTTTPQAPLGTTYGPTATPRDVLGDVRLDGKIAIVTGGYAGVGLETTRALAAAGATVIVPARSQEKARAALEGIDGVEIETLDLAEPASVDALAQRFLASSRPLGMLIDNAGIGFVPLARDARGFESQLATNHLGHFQLTLRLWPALVRAEGARVVALSSRGHVRSAFDFDDPHFHRRPYDKWLAYGQSKTANALFALALDARGRANGVRAFSVHPGAVMTDLVRSMSEEEVRAAVARSNTQSPLKSAEQGAATTVWCAVSPDLAGMGGVYCEDCDIAVAVGGAAPGATGVRPWAMDRDAAERLWTLSEGWCGLTLPV